MQTLTGALIIHALGARIFRCKYGADSNNSGSWLEMLLGSANTTATGQILQLV